MCERIAQAPQLFFALQQLDGRLPVSSKKDQVSQGRSIDNLKVQLLSSSTERFGVCIGHLLHHAFAGE
jgi:hypothetical protein